MTQKKTANKREAGQSIESVGTNGHMIHVASRIFNTPLLIEPNKLQAILHGIGKRMEISVEAPEDERFMAPRPAAFHPGFTSEDRASSGYHLRNGVAILEISGTLVHKGAWLGSHSGMVSYDGLGRQLDTIKNDQDVHTLLLNIHSFGGEVAGCFDLVDQIYQMREDMPITALVSDAACSAAYALASAATEIVVTQAGAVGSIGVVFTHYDLTKKAEMEGVAVTHIYAGSEKILGTPFKSLSAADRKKLQAEVDGIYELFLGKVARNRNMSVDDLRNTEAAVYYAADAVNAGLADRILSPRDILAELIGGNQTPSPDLGNDDTEEDDTVVVKDDSTLDAATADNSDRSTTMQESKAKVVADTGHENENLKTAAGEEGGSADVTAGAVRAERERIQKILGAPEAEQRAKLAGYLALETDMSAEQAIAVLARSPQADSGRTPLNAAMEITGTPGIASPNPPDGDDVVVRIDSAKIYESRRLAARSN